MSDEQHAYWPKSPGYALAPLGRRITVPNPLYEGAPLSQFGDLAGTPAYGPTWYPPNPGASQLSWRGVDAAGPVLPAYDKVRQWLVDLGGVYGAPQSLIDLTNAQDWNSGDTLISAADNMQAMLDDCGVQWSTPETPWSSFRGMIETDPWGPELSEIVRARIAYYCPEFTMRPDQPEAPPPVVYQQTAPPPLVTPSEVIDQPPPQVFVPELVEAPPPAVEAKRYPWGYVIAGAGGLLVVGGAIYFATRKKKRRRRNPRRVKRANPCPAGCAPSSGPPRERANPSGAQFYLDNSPPELTHAQSRARVEQLHRLGCETRLVQLPDGRRAIARTCPRGVRVPPVTQHRKRRKNISTAPLAKLKAANPRQLGPKQEVMLAIAGVAWEDRKGWASFANADEKPSIRALEKRGFLNVRKTGQRIAGREELEAQLTEKGRGYLKAKAALDRYYSGSVGASAWRQSEAGKAHAAKQGNPCSTYGAGRRPPKRVQVVKRKGVKLEGKTVTIPRKKRAKKKTQKVAAPKRRRR